MEITSTYSILPLAGSVLVFIFGLFVWLKKPRQLLHILFFLFDFTSSIWLFGTFMLFNAINSIDQLYWDRFIYIGVIFIPIFMYHFGIAYCGIKNQKWFLVFGYILAFIFLPLSQLSDNFVSGLYYYSWGVHSIAHRYHTAFLIYLAVYFLFFLVNLAAHYRESIGMVKKQVRYVLIGYIIFMTVGPLAFFPAYGTPIYPVIFLSAIPFVALMAYAIIRYNALDLSTIAAEVVVSFVNILALGQIFFSRSNTETFLRFIFWIFILLFSLLLVRSVKKEITRSEEMSTLASSLAKANIRLQELDRQKTDFLSIAAHQLRTPLSITNGYVELLKDGAYGAVTKEEKEIYKNIDESNGHLVKLVDSFLDITRLEQGRTKYDFLEHDINDVIESAVKELNLRAKQKKLDLVWHREINLPKIIFDEEKVRHVIFNFIDNAIKYCDEGVIKVDVVKDGEGVSVRVKDSGLGFGKIDEANFFQKFYRGNNVKGINVNGTGLGLFVCAKFIEAHHGRVWAHSPGLGKGSEFGFWIPIHQA